MTKPALELKRTPRAPPVLSAESASLFEHAVEAWAFTRPDLELLTAALEQLDVYRTAMECVRGEGPTVVNPETGNPKQNPALSAAHAALRAYRQSLAALDLELPTDGFRPRGSFSRRRR